MDRYWAFAVWIPVFPLLLFFFLFGVSDFDNSRSAIEYMGHNPMRPFFRLAFGVAMCLLTLSSAVFITAKMLARR